MQQFKTLKEYANYLDKMNEHFCLKIMGQKTTSSFYTTTMLADMYSHTDNPDNSLPAMAPFGRIEKRSVILDPEAIYSNIVAPTEGINLFQGDVIEHECASKISSSFSNSHKYSVIMSHSCDIANASFFTVMPVFLESEMTQNVMGILRGRAFNSQQDADVAKRNWIKNELLKIVALPAPASGDIEEPFFIPLHLFSTVSFELAENLTAKLRLKYRALAFLQWRLAAVYMRDVQRSDETRDF